MEKTLILKGHIIDSLVLSKLLDKLENLGVECYTKDVKIGAKRKDSSEATFVIESSDSKLIEKAIEYAKSQGASEV